MELKKTKEFGMVDGKKVIQEQLSISEETTFVSEGRTLALTPARLTPVPDAGKLSLDGEWAVKRYPFEEETVLSESSEGWERIQQPGKVFYADPEKTGDETPNWNRVSLAHIDAKDGAMLVKKIFVPENWSGRNIFLRFDAIYPASAIYVNGKKIGEHLSGLTPFECRLDDVSAGDELTIGVRLFRTHKFVKMDMPRHAMEFAGIAQSAYLFATPESFVKDYHLISELDASLKKGRISGEIVIENPIAGRLLVELSREGISVASFECAINADAGVYCVDMDVDAPLFWNDEYPNLYDVRIKAGESEYSYKTGFRSLELSPEGPKLNGAFIKFRGVNHLTFNRESGLHTPKEWLRESLSLMKKANINAIRTHFTGPTDLVELCDEMGFYLLQELPIDWGTNYIHDTDWVGPALMRLEGAIRRDRHHASVMVWSVGNENMPESAKVAEDGWNHLRIYDDFCKTLDPSRPTMFPPPGPANKIKGIFEVRVGDIADIHYSFVLQKEFRKTGRMVNPNSWEGDMVEITREEALERGWSGCWFSSEYGIFNAVPDVLKGPHLSVISDIQNDPLSGKNSQEVFIDRLREEWGNMRFDPTALGGAFFPWMCAGAGVGSEGNPWGWTRWGEDANWGVVTADLLPKPQFWALRVLFSPVWLPERVEWKDGEDVVRFKIMNQYNSIDLNECVFRTQIKPGSRYCCMLREYNDVSIDCPPGATAELSIPMDESVRKALADGNWALCRITILDPNGFSPVTVDMQILPENFKSDMGDSVMPIGPDAII